MASLGAQKLPLDLPGVAVSLTKRAGRDWQEALPGGVRVRLKAGSDVVVVAGLNDDLELSQLPVEGRDAANRALDLVTARSAGSYILRDPSAAAFCWRPTSTGPALRACFEVQSTFTLTAGGPPGAYPVAWHESMRYFRMSQTTADLFDAFRNLYLALESVLSHIAPVRLRSNGRPAEGEGEWTRRALAAANAALQGHNAAMSLASYAPSPVSGDAVGDIYAELYSSVRTAIFHAKQGRVFALPQDQRDRAQVEDALGRYASMYTDLAEVVFGARFLRSGLAPAGFAAMATIVDNWEVGFSNEMYADIEDFDTAAALRLHVLPTVRARELESPFRAAVLGSAPVSSKHLATEIRTLAARSAGEPVSVEPLSAELSFEGVAHMEILLMFQVFSGGFKRQYET